MSKEFNIDDYINLQEESGSLSEKKAYIEETIRKILGKTVSYEAIAYSDEINDWDYDKSKVYCSGLEYLDELEDWKSYVDSKIKEYNSSEEMYLVFSPKTKEQRFGSRTVIDKSGNMIKITNYD